MDKMMEEMGMMAKNTKKSKKKENMSQYDDMHYWTPPKKRDKGFYGHLKTQTLF